MYCPDRAHNLLVSPSQIRTACRGFKAGTALSLDGIHPKAPVILSDPCLGAPALIIVSIEALGAPPIQLWVLEFLFIPKSANGMRGVVSQQAVMRVWEALHTEENTMFAAQNERPYWRMGPCRSPEVLAFVQLARVEAHVAGQERVFSPMAASHQLDGCSYYE